MTTTKTEELYYWIIEASEYVDNSEKKYRAFLKEFDEKLHDLFEEWKLEEQERKAEMKAKEKEVD